MPMRRKAGVVRPDGVKWKPERQDDPPHSEHRTPNSELRTPNYISVTSRLPVDMPAG